MFKKEFEFGIKLGAAVYGYSPENILVKKASQKILDNSLELQQLYSKAGANVLTLAGEGDSVECRILCKCASYDKLLSKEAHDQFIEPVKKAFEKSANPAAKVAAGAALTEGAKSIPNMLAFAATAAGILSGASWWGLRRQSEVDEAETVAKFNQAKKYRQLAREIKEEMKYKQKQQQQKAKSTSFDLF